MQNTETSSQIVGMLAQVLSHPEQALYPYLLNGDFQNELAGCIDKVTGEAWSLPLLTQPFIDFESEYIRLFLVGNKGKPFLSLEAGNHDLLSQGTGRPEFMLNYISWYKHFGLTLKNNDDSSELPDHLVCILEFLSWLIDLEANADTNSSTQLGYQKAQIDFIEKQCLSFAKLLRGKAQAMAVDKKIQPFFVALFNVIPSVLENRQLQLKALVETRIASNDVSVAGPGDIKTTNLWN